MLTIRCFMEPFRWDNIMQHWIKLGYGCNALESALLGQTFWKNLEKCHSVLLKKYPVNEAMDED